jgi:ribonuclease HII
MRTVGVDEVGRGCWAGPVVAGAVLLAEPITGLKDSKLLSKKRREALAAQIEIEAISYGLGWVDAATVDKVGITTAVKMAMEQAVAALTAEYDEIIIDGNLNFLAENPKATTLIKADMTVPAASAASILAKVARDRYMAEAAVKFPGYGFGAHVGYGTAAHIAALQELGICVLHRKSYKPIQKLLEAL